MKPKYLTEQAITSFIQSALNEDIGDGDHSTLSSVPEDAVESAKMIFKDKGIVAGVEIAERIFKTVDSSLEVKALVEEGDFLTHGDIIMEINGKAQSILIAERLALNCIQRMSGIATHTNRVVKLVEGTHTQILDTRKTTPNFRILEKWAVHLGGGRNHRFGLYDMVMLKDNHIDYAGSIQQAVADTKAYLASKNKDLKIEVETRNLDEVKDALEAKVDVIMLDNMDFETMRTAVLLVNGQCKTEASGGITEDNVANVARTGVDFISLGALTHSSLSKDISLKAVK
ncbi:carboxylating nicotinate-nucleotide diphosphorylase [Flammeovirga yaeyamensis]|uniref:Probable nicotinate-nucleotide pyrophosphorylase [carboxylating] n=1 Tax=Flammeovirga yaeyamensis TaxID=367791 RepID=A0AAX1N0Q3_9BACT|nr:carboxylating nicotinate-nucleotide diphosphorylase [Flammeovirga yaeyamensis]MBB3698558.1 nicotinate-nucleotide pyrophosphorylase (carboxylating) [Flammeovirga yaeyamensis]NMF34093.1 carboxylating nicotinate-nucleotide diphosphorylase [Flammeovirga yaeyamensis]QWG01081.1 carboxylating nicotinate-nucleotide diphosphorylase [Flammeovirga yaeyamensis]